jgi:peptidyl-prolyl cis-trans isomerase A (cyclophilin A)
MAALSQEAAPLAAPGTFGGDAATTPATEPGLYATIKTSMGDIKLQLFEKQSPLAVHNFVGLARGAKTWTDPRTGQPTQKPLYNGTTFHRVIPNFMIQGGDPLGNGMGTPGYRFANENSPDLKFDRKGRLAMANAGPNTNGSQFFITVAAYPSLNGGYTIFGQVLEGQDVVDRISQVPRDAQDKPLTPVVIQRIVIERAGAATTTKTAQ